jgi:hypothetical protein
LTDNSDVYPHGELVGFITRLDESRAFRRWQLQAECLAQGLSHCLRQQPPLTGLRWSCELEPLP